jgi:hypothetical protein
MMRTRSFADEAVITDDVLGSFDAVSLLSGWDIRESPW